MTNASSQTPPSSTGKIIVVVFVVSTLAIALTIVSLRITTKPKVDAVLAAASASGAFADPKTKPPKPATSSTNVTNDAR